MEQKHLIHALHLPMPLAFFSGCLAAGTLELPSQTCMIPQLGDQEQVDSFLYSVEYKVIYGYHFLKNTRTSWRSGPQLIIESLVLPGLLWMLSTCLNE